MLVTGFSDFPLRMDFDFFGLVRPGAEIQARTSTSLVISTYTVPSYYISNGARTGIFSFTGVGVRYNSDNEPIAGTITGLKITQGTSVYLKVDGLNLSAASFYQKLENAASGLAPADAIALLFPGDDEFHGTAQDDAIFDRSGHNIFMGGPGRDWIAGGSGNDHIYGQSPNGGVDDGDRLSGGDGSDYIQGNAGQDYISGDGGSDRLNGGQGEDDIDGGSGNDTINGNRDADHIYGGDGNDLIRGGQGADFIDGGDGDDVIMGDRGADSLSGGDGRDIFIFGPDTSSIGATVDDLDRITDFRFGDDHLSLGFVPQAILSGSSLNEAPTVDAARAVAQALLDQHPGNHEVALVNAYAVGTLMFWASDGGSMIDSAIVFRSTGSYVSNPRNTADFWLSDFI